MDSSKEGILSGHPRAEQEYSDSFLSRLAEVKDLRKVKTETLVQMCLRSERPAWEEFFRRYIPLIKQGIRKGLNPDSNFVSQDDMDEAISAIYEKVIVKLVRDGILNNCKTPHIIEPWLATVACNQTYDWLREKSRKKRLPEKLAKFGTRSLEHVVNAETGCTLSDIIPAPATSMPEMEDHPVKMGWLEDVFHALHDMNFKKRWILRLSLIAVLPLSEQEREELGQFSSLGREECDECLSRMLADIRQKKESRAKAMGKAVLLWFELQNLEARQSAFEKDCTDESKDKLLQVSAKIIRVSKRRLELLEEGNRLCLPAHADIAAIIGIPEDKVQQVSIYLRRARQTLANLRGTNHLRACEVSHD